MTPDDADRPALRIEFPRSPGRRFALFFLPLMAASFLLLLIQMLRSPAEGPGRAAGLAVCVAGAALFAAASVAALRSLKRRPTALEAGEKALLLFFGSRADAVEWGDVKGVEQIIVGMTPTYAVMMKGRKKVAFGSDDRALELARQIVRRAGLRWIHEPFTARRPVEPPRAT